MLYQRNDIIEKVLPFVDKPLIKVLTGLRRSGKSSLLKLIKAELIKKEIDPSQIININFESFNARKLTEVDALYRYVQNKLTNNKKHYLLFDEIQEVDQWEKAINSFMVDFDVDIFITGSNSKLLSSELATYLSGRFVSFYIQPLSFQEVKIFDKLSHEQPTSEEELFERFLKIGGFPILHTNDFTQEEAYKVIYDIYTSTILRDTIQRYNIRDIDLLERVIHFAIENMGQTFSANRIVKYFKSQYRKVDVNTIHNYLEALQSSYLLQKVDRYDLKGKEILKTQEKYFLGDHAFVYALFGYKTSLIGGVIENIVYNEVKRRGYKIYVGKMHNTEIDFIGIKPNEKIYLQVAYKMTLTETIKREYDPLIKIKDQYPKWIISLEENRQSNYEGIRHIHLKDFLLDANW